MILRRLQKPLASCRYMYIFSLINLFKSASSALTKPTYAYIHNCSNIISQLPKRTNKLILSNCSSKENYNAFVCKSYKKYKMNKKFSSSINMNKSKENENILKDNNNVTAFHKNTSDVKNFGNFNQSSRSSAFGKRYSYGSKSNSKVSSGTYVGGGVCVSGVGGDGDGRGGGGSRYTSSHTYSGNHSSHHPNQINRETATKNEDATYSLNETKSNTNSNYMNSSMKEKKGGGYPMNSNDPNIPPVNESSKIIQHNTKMSSFNKDNMLRKGVKDEGMYRHSGLGPNSSGNKVIDSVDNARSGMTNNSGNAADGNAASGNIAGGNASGGIYQENNELKSTSYKNTKDSASGSGNNRNNSMSEKKTNIEGISSTNLKGNERFIHLNESRASNTKYNAKNPFISNKKNISTYNTNLSNANSSNLKRGGENVSYAQNNFKRETSDNILNSNLNMAELNKNDGVVIDPNMNSIDMSNKLSARDSYGKGDGANNDANVGTDTGNSNRTGNSRGGNGRSGNGRSGNRRSSKSHRGGRRRHNNSGWNNPVADNADVNNVGGNNTSGNNVGVNNPSESTPNGNSGTGRSGKRGSRRGGNRNRRNSNSNSGAFNSLNMMKNGEEKMNEIFDNSMPGKDYMQQNANNLRGMTENQPAHGSRSRNSKMVSYGSNTVKGGGHMSNVGIKGVQNMQIMQSMQNMQNMANMPSMHSEKILENGNRSSRENEKAIPGAMMKNTRNMSYDNKGNSYMKDANQANADEAKKRDPYANYSSNSLRTMSQMNTMNSVGSMSGTNQISGANNPMDDHYSGSKQSCNVSASTPFENMEADAFLFHDFNEFVTYMYKDENILTLFYIRKNYLKAESREEFVTENDKIKYSIIWSFPSDEKITVTGTHSTKKLSKKVCVKKILQKLKNISVLEIDQMTKWMINSLNVVLKVQHKNMETKMNNNNMYCTSIEWKINNKMYHSMGIHVHEKIAEIIATQNLYMILYDIKDQLIKEMESGKMSSQQGAAGGMNSGKAYENSLFDKMMNNSNNRGYNDHVANKMGGTYEYGKGQMMQNKNMMEVAALYKSGNPSNKDFNAHGMNNCNTYYNPNDGMPKPQCGDNAMMHSVQGGVVMSGAVGGVTNMNPCAIGGNNVELANAGQIDGNNLNMNLMNYPNGNNMGMPIMNDKNIGPGVGALHMNGLNNPGIVPPAPVITDPTDLIAYNLTKQDSGSIQMLRNNIASRYKVHQTENFEQVYNLFKCTLEWEWKNGKIACKTKSVGYGTTKNLAKCEAAYDMLVKNNLIEYISSTDRKNAHYIKDLIQKDVNKAMKLAIQFIMQYSSNAWSIFLVYLLRELLIDGNYDHINRLLTTVVEVSKEGRIEADKINESNSANAGGGSGTNTGRMDGSNSHRSTRMNNGGQNHGMYSNNADGENYVDSSSSLFFCNPYIKNRSDNSNYVHKLVSIDLWEKLIDECVVVLNDKLCFHCITLLKEVELDYSIFISKCAHDYYKKYRIMLALELQANLSQSIQEKRDFEYLHENKSLLLKVKSATMPILSFTCTLTLEEKEWMKSTQMREDDIVLLKPCDLMLTDEDAWSSSLIGTITSTKSDNTVYNINVRIFSAENTRKANVKYSKYKLFLLLNIVTHERMLQALRGITFISSIPTTNQSPYVFTPEIRFLILHSYNKYSKHIAQTGKLNHEIAEYEKIKIDSLNHDSSKNNTQEDLLTQYSGQAKNPYGDLLNDALNRQIGKTHTDDIDQYLVESINLPTNLPLNDSQKLACLSALTRRLTLVQGPPGTGKTHVACAIIDSWHRQNSNKKILAVADSNVAANNLVEGLKKRNIQAVRVGAGSDSDFHEEAIMDFHRYKDLLKLRKNNLQKEAKVMKALLFLEAVKKYNVVIATCVGSGHEIFDNEKFERVIIDECAQSIEPSNLIPLGHNCNNLVLIGDHKQLPPTIISSDATKLGLDRSLLERFVLAKIAPVHLLTTQRRMHLSICTFPNIHFYDNKLKTENVTEENRPIIKGFLWPNPKCRLAFIDVSLGKPGSKFENAYGTSKFNLYEIEPLISVLKSIVNEGCVSVDEIGILTAYDAQKIKLKKAVQDAFPYEAACRIEIDSIDGFQGKEKDLILFSAVRSNANNELGFLKDARRLNVMLTRAKRGVILFGDQFTLANDPENWLPWLNWISSKRAVVHITKLNEHLENADYSLIDKLNKINKTVNLKNVSISDNYFLYGNDTGFSNDYNEPQIYNQNEEPNFTVGLNDTKEEVEPVEEIVENWEDLL
ncbi:hypothetical protein C922_03028 [Plasmodium inui San Antonio 1]|uniref:Erythrocyte membrane-associated antigen n=1 Tax=Plasmodium inui San Antonio 1 TaxID=1237626 RepID=W7A670_9APIC|nr:hypothetical protein C922_03028 [Plasmodium inui San Antonio 1]EUD66703.1 hypothetical protein C922_03028 [Plasmodium inui San Antonio 1]